MLLSPSLITLPPRGTSAGTRRHSSEADILSPHQGPKAAQGSALAATLSQPQSLGGMKTLSTCQTFPFW